VEERKKQVASQQQERQRTWTALQTHAGLAAFQKSNAAASDGLEDGILGTVDSQVSKIITLLFKSVFARRIFIAHIMLLHSWLLFLLWWMSTRGHRHVPKGWWHWW